MNEKEAIEQARGKIVVCMINYGHNRISIEDFYESTDQILTELVEEVQGKSAWEKLKHKSFLRAIHLDWLKRRERRRGEYLLLDGSDEHIWLYNKLHQIEKELEAKA